jgi:hypothetical protein
MIRKSKTPLRKVCSFEWVNRAMGNAVKCVHLNNVMNRQIAGRSVVIKSRNLFGRSVLPLANWFFGAGGAAVSYWADPRDWQSWTTSTFEMLNPPFRSRAVGRDAVCSEVLPGKSLWSHLKDHTLTPRMLQAAGIELRRTHSLWSAYHKGPWSHGDCAMCNILYDPDHDRARLIDFEIVHHHFLPAIQRQAEDLLSVLLDLTGVNSADWLELSRAFLDAYGESAVIAEMRSRFTVPHGIGILWWKVRINFADTREVMQLLTILEESLTLTFGPPPKVSPKSLAVKPCDVSNSVAIRSTATQ